MTKHTPILIFAIGTCLMASAAFAADSGAAHANSALSDASLSASSVNVADVSAGDAGTVRATPAPAAPPTPAATPTAPATITNSALGTSVIGRFFKYQAAEMGQAASPLETDPNAPPARRAGWVPAPVTSPPYPFTEYPYGGTTLLGVNRANSVDSPLMVAIADTGLGKALSAAHIQTYGWVDVGANISTSHVHMGNAPAAYAYDPNTVLLNQVVLYVERTPDTVQDDHVDWGFRVSGIYGSDYHYTASRGFLVDQGLFGKNKVNGYDMPMIYAELFIPKLAQGLMLRVGRYISVPDIEAQLAPNNYMYTHSMTYTFDNYTNEGVQATLAATKNLFLQFGISAGSDTALWNAKQMIPNIYLQQNPGAADPLFPHATFKRDPGAELSYTGCLRYQTDTARDNIYLCADAINNGTWGYNNLQWYGLTYYHKFTNNFHVAFEAYTLSQNHVLNLKNPAQAAVFTGGGTPFSPQYYPFNGPSAAQCNSTTALSCTARVVTELSYWNYQFSPLDNISFREEFYNDEEGQRTGVKTRYYDVGIGWQHWFSPQIEVRPEVVYYHSLDAKAFNIDTATGDNSHARNYQLMVSGDVIIHF